MNGVENRALVRLQHITHRADDRVSQDIQVKVHYFCVLVSTLEATRIERNRKSLDRIGQ